jgi:hypothetical protein
MSRREICVKIGLEDSIVFENPDYDSAIIGYDENSRRIVYDYEKMIEHLIDKEGMTYEEAVEFIDYNTVRACPHMGSNTPIILRNIIDYINIRNNG